LTLDIEEFLSQNWGVSIIDGLSRPIEGPTKHLNTDGHSKDITGELDGGPLIVDFRSSFENLYNSLLSLDLQNLALSLLAIAETNLNDLCIFGELDVVKDDKWTLNVHDGPVIHSGVDDIVSVDCIEVGFEVLLFLVHILFLVLYLSADELVWSNGVL